MEEVHIYDHPNIFEKKYSKSKEEIRYIGIPYTKEELESKDIILHLSKEPLQIAERIKTTGEIERKTSFESINERLCVMRDGILIKDDLMDDLSLIVSRKDSIAVILGCGHSGIINILNQVQKMTNNAEISYLIGGIHLIDATEDRIHKTIEALKEFNIEKMALCHCTGPHAFLELQRAFGDRIIINNTGNSIEL